MSLFSHSPPLLIFVLYHLFLSALLRLFACICAARMLDFLSSSLASSSWTLPRVSHPPCILFSLLLFFPSSLLHLPPFRSSAAVCSARLYPVADFPHGMDAVSEANVPRSIQPSFSHSSAFVLRFALSLPSSAATFHQPSCVRLSSSNSSHPLMQRNGAFGHSENRLCSHRRLATFTPRADAVLALICVPSLSFFLSRSARFFAPPSR